VNKKKEIMKLNITMKTMKMKRNMKINRTRTSMWISMSRNMRRRMRIVDGGGEITRATGILNPRRSADALLEPNM
jgi:hypothetical protein